MQKHLWASSAVLFATVLGSAACSGTEDLPDRPAPGDAAMGPADAGDAGVSATDGGRNDSGTADASAGDASPTDGGPIDRRIDPIEVGRAWTYQVQVLGTYPACANGVHTSSTVGMVPRDGKNALQVESLCPGAGIFEYAVEGDRVWSYFQGAWRLSLDEPVVDGHTWSDDFFDYVWADTGTVTVPAGTFADCWSARKVVTYPSYTVFCRGVGPIHWHYEDGLGNGYDALLTRKNF